MPKSLTRVFASLLLMLVMLSTVSAQGATPRYTITSQGAGLSTDGCQLVFPYFISNNGAPSTIPTTIELRVVEQSASPLGGEDVLLASAVIPPLEPGRGHTVELVASAAGYPANSQQTFEVRILLDGTDAFGSVPRIVNLNIPPVPTTCRAATPASIPFYISFLDYTFDLANPRQEEILLLAVLVILLLLILLILLRLRRLLFGRPPAFGNHLPPYASIPPADPHSQAGIRQSWQLYAQNNTIAQPSARGANAVVKLLLGADGQYLNGWTITALRLSQYDQYGRVARTTTLGSSGVVRALDRLAHSRKPLDADQIERRVTPLARQLTRQLLKRVTSRSSVLPVALDLRLRGSHGEVSIVFELYSNDGANWILLDRWQPEMSVTGKTIYEMYTYTIHGQSGGETFKDFRQRLPLDMARLLGELIAPRVRPPTPSATSTQTAPRVPPSPEAGHSNG